MDIPRRSASHRLQSSKSIISPSSIYTSNASKTRKMSQAMSPKQEMTEEELRAKRFLANSRERQRTEELNDAFKRLRQTIPSMPSDKLSKIHTLRIAANYIRFLDEINECAESTSRIVCGAVKTDTASGRKANRLLTITPYAKPPGGETLVNLRATFNHWREQSQQPSASPSIADYQRWPSSSTCDSFASMYMSLEGIATGDLIQQSASAANTESMGLISINSNIEDLDSRELLRKYF